MRYVPPGPQTKPTNNERNAKVSKKPTVEDRSVDNSAKIGKQAKLSFSCRKPIVGDRPMFVLA